MLAVTGGKGGTGKTTTTLGLARAFDGPTLAVDADWDLPDLHALAGVERARPTDHGGTDGAGGTDGTADPVDPTDAVRSAGGGVSVLPAPPDAHERDDAAATLARVDAADAGTTLVDCPAGAGPDAAAPLRAADAAVLAVTPCAPALRDAAKAAAMARTLGTPVRGAVLVRAAAVPPGVAEFLGCPVLARVPAVDEPVLSAARVRRAYERAAAALDVGASAGPTDDEPGATVAGSGYRE